MSIRWTLVGVAIGLPIVALVIAIDEIHQHREQSRLEQYVDYNVNERLKQLGIIGADNATSR